MKILFIVNDTLPVQTQPRLDEELVELQAFIGDGIDARRRHAADLAAAEGADVTPADVVGQHEHHIGPVLRRGGGRQAGDYEAGHGEDCQ